MQNEQQNEKISFKPLHDGVGFHPFSEGLPYAPPLKRASIPRPEIKVRTYPQTGTGAVTPKTTRQLQQQSVIPAANKTVVNSAPIPLKNMSVSTHEPSIMRKRFFAYVLDTVIHIGFWTMINLIALFGFHFSIDNVIISQNWMGFTIFFAFSQWVFIGMQEVLFENSIGKAFFGLEFKRSRKSFLGSSLFLRSIVFTISACFFGLGLIFHPQDHFAEVQLKT